MDLKHFIAFTKQTIAENGIDAYFPTLIYETPRRVIVTCLEPMPPDDEVEEIVKSWVATMVKRERDYLVAYRLSNTHFKVISKVKGVLRERRIKVQ